MKRIKGLFLTLLSLMLLVNLALAQSDVKPPKSDTVKYWVSMDCDGCVAKIEKNIAFEKGVKDLIVDLKTNTVVVAFKPKKTDKEKLEKAIKDLGFKTEVILPEEKVKK